MDDPWHPESDPRQPWQSVAVMRGEPELDLFSEADPATVEWLGASNGTGNETLRLAIVSAAPGGRIQTGTMADGVDCRWFGGPGWDLSNEREGATVEVGGGALVRTAGFLEDGHLFYTNIADIEEAEPAWPRVDWYAWEEDPVWGSEPLPVYVYDQDRREQPGSWKGLAGNAADANTAAGSPVEMPSELGAADAAAGLGYFTTIPGFNEALKGLSTSTLRVAHIPPELGYTRPGNEDHPLYGEPLVFVIQVVAVADAPCPSHHLEYRPFIEQPAPGCFRR